MPFEKENTFEGWKGKQLVKPVISYYQKEIRKESLKLWTTQTLQITEKKLAKFENCFYYSREATDHSSSLASSLVLAIEFGCERCRAVLLGTLVLCYDFILLQKVVSVVNEILTSDSV